VVALLVCVALFLSATVGLGLVIWQDAPTVQRSARLPMLPPEPTPAASGAIGRLDQRTRVATVGTASMTLPGAPYLLSPDPMQAEGLDLFFLASAPVHQRYDGRHTWSAAVLLGRLSPGVGGPELEDRGRAAVEQLGRTFFSSHPTRVGPVAVADHAVDGHAGLVLTTRVGYQIDHLPSRYDELTAVVVALDDRSVVVAVTSVPDASPPDVAAAAARSLDSLTLS